MEPTLIAGLAAAAFGLAGAVYGEIRHRQARKLRKQAVDIAAAATKAIIGSLGASLASPLASQVTGVESIGGREFFDALNAADLPTPGCGCAECDARRMRRASADVKRDER
jgi:hypothetical protein